MIDDLAQGAPAATQSRVRPSTVGTVAAFALFILIGALFASLGAALPSLRTHFGMADNAGSTLVSVFNAGSFVTTIGLGAAARRVRPAKVLPGLVVVIAVAGVGLCLAPSFNLFMAAAVLGGLGFGGIVLYLNTVFASGYGDRSILMLNLLNAAFMLGSIGGPLAVSATSADTVRYVYLVLGLLIVLCLPVGAVGRTLETPVPSQEKAAKAAALPRPYLPILVSFAAIGLVYAATESGIGAWESTHLVAIGFSKSAGAALTGAFWAGHMVGRFVVPFVTSKIAPSRVVSVCTLVVVAALLGCTAPGFAPYGYVLAGLAFGPVFPTVLGWLATVSPALQEANATVLASCMVGGGSSVLIGVIVGTHTGAPVPLTLAAFAALCAVAIAVTGRVASSARRVAVPVPAEALA